MGIVDTIGLRQEWDLVNEQRDRQSPVKQFTYVDVEFSAADTDLDIAHPFSQASPDLIRWLPVALSPAATIYRASGTDRVAWSNRVITLRASSPCSARLLLFLERPSR